MEDLYLTNRDYVKIKNMNLISYGGNQKLVEVEEDAEGGMWSHSHGRPDNVSCGAESEYDDLMP